MFNLRTGLFCFVALACTKLPAQGIVLPGVGPVNRSMAGVAVAAPLDASGAIHWNPATIGAVGNQVDIGVELLNSRHEITSSFNGLSATTSSQGGMPALPAINLVYHPSDESPLTFGLGLNAVGGFYVNFRGSATNPVLSPPPPNGVGVGPLFAKLSLLQISPVFSYQVTERLAVGGGITGTVSELQVSPGLLSAPDDANGDTFPTYPSAVAGRLRYGLGFRLGAFYRTESCWDFGVSFKSPQWFERYEWNSSNEIGAARQLETTFMYPMIVSGGAAYRGFQHITLATDIRWIDYQSTKAFGDGARFNADGSVNGLGWQSVWSYAFGSQLQLTEKISARVGYSYNQNPIPDQFTFFSLGAPGVFQHSLTMGASYQLASNLLVSAAWVHGFHSEIAGQFLSPLGPVPGSALSVSQETDSAVFGLSLLY